MASIELKNVHLSYPVYGTGARDFKSSLISMATGGTINNDNKIVHIEALKDISFSLESGDRLALIGHNGAGKSTLLKLLGQIYHPTQGTLIIKGKSSCLFDIMMGMDPELNGYENIILRSCIAGLSKQDILKITPKVDEFCDLGQFMKMPFKTYSAGMQLRLAFGIITHIFSEILYIDEVINVGDSNFGKKALTQLEFLIDQSEILVISTHDLTIAEKLCNKAIWLDHGEIKLFDEFQYVKEQYARQTI